MTTVNLVSETLVVAAILVVLIGTAPLATALVVVLLGPLVLIALRVVKPRVKHLGRVSQHEGARSGPSPLRGTSALC